MERDLIAGGKLVARNIRDNFKNVVEPAAFNGAIDFEKLLAVFQIN